MIKALRAWVERIARDTFWRCLPEISRSVESMEPTIRVKLDDSARLPVRAHATDAGADLRCMEDVVVPARDSIEIDTGVHVELPANTVGMIKSKSGLNIRAALNVEGVIDEGYTGSIKLRVYNHGAYDYEFKAGDKVTQLVVMPVVYPDYIEVDDIDGGDRGDSGIGSTGR